MQVRTRFAPSPTGYLHIGGVRTALYSYLYARRHGGTFVLRIEDTDRERSTEASVRAILDGMAWLGLDADEGPFYQSERMARYGEVIETMLAAGTAYRCYCTKQELEKTRSRQMAAGQKPRYDGRCRDGAVARDGVDPVVRFRSPREGEVVIDDLVKGRIAIANAELDDLIIARSDGTPTYNFTVVVDDLDMRITHVIRGDDHVNNTPRQVNILSALGAQPPAYAHLPMILGDDGARLSKRHGAVSVLHYAEAGYLPEALLNYLVRLGWSHGDREVFSVEEMIDLFDLADVNRSAARFDVAKLDWLNEHYLKNSPAGRIGPLLVGQIERRGLDPQAGPAAERVVELYRERATTVADIAEAAAWLYGEIEGYEPKAAKKWFRGSARDVLRDMAGRLAALDTWEEAAIDAAVQACMSEMDVKMGAVAQPIRVAVTGNSFSPPIGATLALLGRERSLARIGRAAERLGNGGEAS